MIPAASAVPGTVDVISPWELQLENRPVYKYANLPRGAWSQTSLPQLLASGAFAQSFAAVLFGVVTNGEAIAAAANEAYGQKITHVHRPATRLLDSF